jgi:uncharacterized protein
MWVIDIVVGITIGFCFGYILQRTGITKYPRVMGMLLLKDFKILKFMLTAVTTSMILFYILGDLGIIKLGLKTLDWGKLVGGLFFGTGMALLGYCPGTMAARLGEGKKDAIIGIAGMVTGIFIFALLISPIKSLILNSEVTGDISVLLGINHWIIIIPSAIAFSLIIFFVNKNFDDNRKNF